MDPVSAKTSRKPRADSLRNRERLISAARAVFSAGGPDASLEAVARKAEVGIGTLYRHFPTREALFQAVYRQEVDDLVALAARLPAEASPTEALRRWLHALVGVVATKKGMLVALKPAERSADRLYAESSARYLASGSALLTGAIEAGAIRDDVTAEDVMRAVYGLCHAPPGPNWYDNVVRLVDIFIDGLVSS